MECQNHQSKFDVFVRALFSRVGCCVYMWLQISFSWGNYFLCCVYIAGVGGLGQGALLHGVVIDNMKLDFLDLS